MENNNGGKMEIYTATMDYRPSSKQMAIWNGSNMAQLWVHTTILRPARCFRGR